MIIPLTAHHDRAGFDCGEDAVNRFLRERARKHATLEMSKTFVLVEDAASSVIQGFHATLGTSVKPEIMPAAK